MKTRLISVLLACLLLLTALSGCGLRRFAEEHLDFLPWEKLDGLLSEEAAPEPTPEETAAPAPPEETAMPEPDPGPESEPEPERVWEPDIVFSTTDQTGAEWTDACFAEANLTMLNLWAYWCPPCVGEMPDLQRLSEDYASRGLQILGLSEAEYASLNEDTASELGITYPRLDYTEAFDSWMQTGYIPTTIFVDSSGKVVGDTYVGSHSYSEWAAAIEALLP